MTQSDAEAASIRPYRRGDLDALYALDVLCFPPPFRFSRSMMRAAAEAGNAVSALAWDIAVPGVPDGETLLGFCLGSIESMQGEPVGYIATLDVHPSQRRRGLGLYLLRRTEELLEGRDAHWVALHVSVQNDAAQRLYAAAGYERGSLVRRFYGRGGDAWMYGKRLGGNSRAS